MTRTRGPRRDQRGELVDVEPEVVRHPDRDRDRRRADEPRQRLVDRVARVRDEDLVARVDQTEDRVEHHALAADRDEDLERLDRRSPCAPRRRRRSPRAGPGSPGTADSGWLRRRARPWPPRGCWPACRSRARRAGGGRSSDPAASSARARAETSNALSVPMVPIRAAMRIVGPPIRAASGGGRTTRSRGVRRAAACTTDTSAHRTR